MKRKLILMFGAVIAAAAGAPAQTEFKELVGDVQVGEVKKSATLRVPYITWGGDMATFYANGGRRPSQAPCSHSRASTSS